MRKFDFLSTPATILANLTAATLKINDFMARQLFQYMKVVDPTPLAPASETLCPSCGKLREN
jgi:hypothetical protein